MRKSDATTGANASVGGPRTSRVDLDRIDEEVAEARDRIEHLESLVGRDLRLGHPTKHSRELLETYRESLRQLLDRRTAMFTAFVTGR